MDPEKFACAGRKSPVAMRFITSMAAQRVGASSRSRPRDEVASLRLRLIFAPTMTLTEAPVGAGYLNVCHACRQPGMPSSPTAL